MSTLRANFSLDRGSFHLDVKIEAPARGITGVFGSSGSGKTTLLRCLAGLEPGARGYMRLHDQVWQDDRRGVRVPAHRRAIGYVFQDGRLFPHLSVLANLRYGARRAGTDTDGAAFEHVVELLGIGHLLKRYPRNLSGGEQQRVTIGRALLTRPQLLLMDEPMASLDRQRKSEIMPYLESLHRELSIPVIYVSHALEEIVRLADTLVLVDAGAVQSSGALADVLSRLDLPLAHTEDASTLVDATVAGHDEAYHLTRLAFRGGSFSIAHRPISVGENIRLLIHARDVSLALTRTDDSSILNILDAIVVEIFHEERGQTTVRLKVGDTHLLARITRKSCDHLGLAPGARVYAQVKSVALAE